MGSVWERERWGFAVMEAFGGFVCGGEIRVYERFVLLLREKLH